MVANSELAVRILFLAPILLVLAAGEPAPPREPFLAAPRGCAKSDFSVATVMGTVLRIVPEPEPFRAANIDIRLAGPCRRMWMEVLKRDAERCHVGDRIEARGMLTADPDSHAWQMNALNHPYMRLADDFRCHS
jgi:hypothetical protein